MKTLLTSLIVLMCSCLTAGAQTASPEVVGTSSVTSTIRVRIPDFASVTLQENKIVSDLQTNLNVLGQESRSAEAMELQANKRWILQTERLYGRKDLSDSDSLTDQAASVLMLVTATPQ